MNYRGQCVATGGGSEHPIDKIIHDKYFPSKTDGFFIEAGANDGLFISTCKVFEDIGWNGINIEPNKTMYEKLIVNRPLSINLMVALSDKSGDESFEEIDYENGGFSRISNLKTNDEIDNRFRLKVKTTYKVKTKTYIDVIEENNVKKVDLFVLDVEGYEIEAIHSMTKSKCLPEVFCIEWPHIGIDNLKNVITLVFDNLYVCDYVDTLNAIFIKK